MVVTLKACPGIRFMCRFAARKSSSPRRRGPIRRSGWAQSSMARRFS